MGTAYIKFYGEQELGRYLARWFPVCNTTHAWVISHMYNVYCCTKLINEAIGASAEERMISETAALFHDVGKFFIPARILNKQGKLSAAEYEIVRWHPNTWINPTMLPIDQSLAPRVQQICRQHHERLDGRGYPFGLGKSELDPLTSRIVLADSFDAMSSSQRPYGAPKTVAESCSELNSPQNRGQFDAQLVTMFVSLVPELMSQFAS